MPPTFQDVVGTTGAIITVVDAGIRTISWLSDKVDKTDECHAKLVVMQNNFFAYQGLLKALRNMAENADPDSHTVGQLNEPLQTCLEAATVVTERLAELETMFLSKSWKLTWARLIDHETEEALGVLNRTRPILDLAIQTDMRKLLESNRVLAKDIKHDVDDVKDKVNNIKEMAQSLTDAESVNLAKSLLANFMKVDMQATLQSHLGEVRDQARSGTWLLTSADWGQWMQQTGRSILLRGRCKWRVEGKLCCH